MLRSVVYLRVQHADYSLFCSERPSRVQGLVEIFDLPSTSSNFPSRLRIGECGPESEVASAPSSAHLFPCSFRGLPSRSEFAAQEDAVSAGQIRAEFMMKVVLRSDMASEPSNLKVACGMSRMLPSSIVHRGGYDGRRQEGKTVETRAPRVGRAR